MKLREICETLEQIAPVGLAEDWDNVGLLVGDPEQSIRRIFLTIDLTKAVLAEARQQKTDLILAYHPPIWEPLKKVVAGQGASPLLYEVIRSGRAIYAMHTALDIVSGGINDVLAQIVGIIDPQPLELKGVETSGYCKLVVFLPENDLEKVSEAIFTSGGGRISKDSKYGKCSFRCRGVGTFQGDETSNPTVGRAGKFEQAEELRLETIVPTARLGAAVKAMLAAHSYEEVAYDVYPMLDTQADKGLGRFGELPKPVAVPALVEKIKKSLKVKTVGLIGPQRRKVKRAAVGAGSCGTLLRDVIRRKCDFYLTGELKYHHALELQEAGVTTMCVGHSHSERIMLAKVAGKLKKDCPGVEVKISRKDHDPINWS
jgi:dinuclear metal center YbgI/SA1388 family protein